MAYWNVTVVYISVITARNEVGARLCFYMCLWFCSQAGGEGVCPSACWDTHPPEQTPPRSRHPPLGADTPWPGSRHPPAAGTPWEQTPPGADIPPEQTPPRADTPPEQTSPRADTPLEQTPQPEQTPPAWREIRAISGRYASYWNAYLWFE